MAKSIEEKRLYWNYQKDLLKLKKMEFKEDLTSKMETLQRYCDEDDSYVNLPKIRDDLGDLIKTLDKVYSIEREVKTYADDINDEFV